MTTLEGVYALRLEPQPRSLSENGQAERIYGAVASANYFILHPSSFVIRPLQYHPGTVAVERAAP